MILLEEIKQKVKKKLKDKLSEKKERIYVLKTQFGKHSVEKKKPLKEEIEKRPLMGDKIHSYEPNLGPKESKAILDYTDDSSDLNHRLHQNYNGLSIPEKIIKDHIRYIDQVFSNKENHVGKDHIVYTGLPESPERIFQKEKKLTGKRPSHVIVHLPAYTSASTEKDKAHGFAKNDSRIGAAGTKNALKIHVSAHHPSMSIQGHSWVPEEKEVLLHRGTRLKIYDDPRKDELTGVHQWRSEVIGHHPDKIHE